MHWLKELKGRILFKEPLNTHTTLQTGGPADVWIEPTDLAELRKVVYRCVKEKIPYLVVGKGSNILFSDRGFRGIVISLNSSFFTRLELRRNYVSCGAGLPLDKLIRQTKLWGLGGLEFLSGIPATTAGAVVMNAGNRQKDIGSLVKSVTVLDRKDKIRILKDKQLRFSYRRSNLNRYIIHETVLRLAKKSPQKVQADIVANLTRKRKTQDLTAKSAGCIFKNPHHRLTAGQMIEACGLKCRRKGDAQISAKHANYIINRNKAKSRDISYLIDLAQREVKKKFGIFLEPEIKIIR